jgi:alpha-L-fucosidase
MIKKFMIFLVLALMHFNVMGLNARPKKKAPVAKLHFGLLFHYLNALQNTLPPWNQNKITSWDECVNDLNVATLANEVKNTGAEYVILTTQQIDRYFCFPNSVYEKATGYKRGDATSHRDLISDLYQALGKYHIKLFLYATGDGPRADDKASIALNNPSKHPSLKAGNPFQVDKAWVTSWSAIIKSISLQYKNKISGWWIDGCYGFIGYNRLLLSKIKNAAKSGNPNAIVALNRGPGEKVIPYSLDDYTAGETNDFKDMPYRSFETRNKTKWHTLSYLGSDWSKPGIKYTTEFMINYINKVKSLNGMVTLDVCLHRDGTIDSAQYTYLKKLQYK